MKMKLFLSTFVFLAVASSSVQAQNDEFRDVPLDNWAYPALAKVVELGQINRMKAPLDLHRPITRIEFAAAISGFNLQHPSEDVSSEGLKANDIIAALSREFVIELKLLDTLVSENYLGRGELPPKIRIGPPLKSLPVQPPKTHDK